MFPTLAPVTRNLIIANVLMFGLQQFAPAWTTYYLALWPLGGPTRFSAPFEFWQLLTYGFLHGGLAHIFFNMFAMFMFGSEIERSMGTKKYLSYYFVCTIGAAIAQISVMASMQGPPIPTVGASGAVFGILLAFGIAYPDRRLIMIPIPIPLPAWLFVTLYALLELYLGVFGRQQGVAHFAHLGGAAAGYLLILYWRYARR